MTWGERRYLEDALGAAVGRQVHDDARIQSGDIVDADVGEEAVEGSEIRAADQELTLSAGAHDRREHIGDPTKMMIKIG